MRISRASEPDEDAGNTFSQLPTSTQIVTTVISLALRNHWERWISLWKLDLSLSLFVGGSSLQEEHDQWNVLLIVQNAPVIHSSDHRLNIHSIISRVSNRYFLSHSFGHTRMNETTVSMRSIFPDDNETWVRGDKRKTHLSFRRSIRFQEIDYSFQQSSDHW